MVAGCGVNVTGASNIIYGECDSLIPIGNIIFTHSTLTIVIGRAGSCTACTVAPIAIDSYVGHRVMVGIVHNDRYSGGPISSLLGA